MVIAIGKKIDSLQSLEAALEFAFQNYQLFLFPNVEMEVHVGIVYKGIQNSAQRGNLMRIPFGMSLAERVDKIYLDVLNRTAVFPIGVLAWIQLAFLALKEKNSGEQMVQIGIRKESR